MIKRQYLSIIILMAMILSFNSCNWIDPELNNDPDAVTDVPLKLLLPSVEVTMSYILGGQDVSGYTSMWMQHSVGTARQSKVINNYNITEADINNLWGSMYDGGMMDCNIIINKAGEDAPHYKGIGQILMALWLGNATDLFGDIPYSDAFNGAEGIWTPAYDSQESIYQTIQKLLDDAIVNLSSTSNEVPVEGDYIYGGDPAMWIKAAYTLKARYTLHLSEVNGQAAFDQVISIMESGEAMASNADDMAFYFGENTSENNPVYQFCDQRGDIRNNPVLFGTMAADTIMTATDTISDPRIFVYQATPKAKYYGGLVYGQRASRVELITATEMHFMAAEAFKRKGDDANATVHLKAALKTNTDKYRGYSAEYDAVIDDWVNGKIAKWEANPPSLEEIMTQKWIALYLQPEVWVDYRRTGFPVLTPVTGSNIPSRYLYPTDERLYNPNTPETTIWQPVWWDQ